MSDDELVSRAKRGDPEAWRELYRQHAGRLLAWLQTRPDADAAISAEDLASEAWLVAAAKVPDFSGTSSDFAGWLFGIARNLASNAHHRADRRQTAPMAISDSLVPVRPQASPEGDTWVHQMLTLLPPRERDAVGCIDGLGMDASTTGVALGISPVAVRVARHRGLRRLRRLLDQDVERVVPLKTIL